MVCFLLADYCLIGLWVEKKACKGAVSSCMLCLSDLSLLAKHGGCVVFYCVEDQFGKRKSELISEMCHLSPEVLQNSL